MSLDGALGRLEDWLGEHGGEFRRFLGPPDADGGEWGALPFFAYMWTGRPLRVFPGAVCAKVERIYPLDIRRMEIPRTGRTVIYRRRNCPLAEYECGRAGRCPLGCGGDFSKAEGWHFTHRGFDLYMN